MVDIKNGAWRVPLIERVVRATVERQARALDQLIN